MASIKDVAADAGVSVATVSYVCNKTKYVSPELTERVLTSIEKLGYTANPVARNLRKRQSGVIGVVLQNIRNIFFPQLLAGLEEFAQERDVSLMFFNTYDDINVEKKAVTKLREMWVDGIILDSCVNESDAEEYRTFLDEEGSAGKSTPMVLLERSLGSRRYSSVAINNRGAAYEATQHLINVGKRSIVHLACDIDWSMAIDRRDGYEEAMHDFGLPAFVYCKAKGLRPKDGYNSMKALLESGREFDGLFATNDQLAMGAIKAISESGRRIPEDIAVVGFDNVFVSSMIEPGLTSVNVPKYSMGVEAAKLLFSAIRKPEGPPERKVLPAQLVVRKSSDLAAAQEWDLFGW